MESVNLLVNSNGTVVRSEVVGALKMRTYLSGMPECKLGLNDKVCRPTLCCFLCFAWQWFLGVAAVTDHAAAATASAPDCCCHLDAQPT